MSYITTKLSGIIRSRLWLGRVIAKKSLTTCSRIVAVESKTKITAGGFRINSQHFHQIQNYSTEPVKLYSESRVPKILSKLASNRVSLHFDFFTTIRPSLFKNYNITVDIGFNILKSCSQLIDRSTGERIKLVNECWNELVPMLKTPTKDHLILLLQAYRRAGLKSLDNYQSFFEKYNCPMDAEIFAELMYITCQNEETMEKAEALLKDIETQNIELNDRFYSALILGYSKQGLNAVEKVLEAMKSNGIAPSSCTNTELIKAYILNENYDRAMEVLQQSDDYDTDQLIDIVRSAANKGNEVIIKKALSLLTDTIRNAKLIAPNLQNICIELIYTNRNRSTKLDPYQLIIQHLPMPVFGMEDTTEYGTFLIKEMIVTNESVSNILQFCENLIESKRNMYAIHACCMYSLVFNLPASRDFLEALAAREQLRPHYYWPLIARARNQNDVIDIIKFATKSNTILDTTTLLDWVLPRMNTLIDSQETLRALTDAGVRMLELKTAIITFLLNNNRPKEALDIASRSTSPIDPSIVKPALSKFVRGHAYKRNAYTTATLMKKLQNRCIDKLYDLAGQVAQSVCNKFDQSNDFASTKQLLIDYQRLEVKISQSSANAILNKLTKNRNIHTDLGPIVQSLVSNELFPDVQTDQKAAAKNESEIESLQQQLIEFKANGFPTHGILYRLFLKYVQYEKYDEAIKIKEECDKMGVLETPAVLSTALKLWTAIKHEDKALKTLEELQTKHSNFKIDTFKIVDLATLLVSKNRLDDAKTLINKLDQYKGRKTSYMSNNVWHLLNAASEYSVKHGKEESMTGYFLKTLINKGHCEHSNTLLGTVIKEYLDKKRIHEAVATYEHYVKEYQKTPQCVSLLTLLIELSNAENISEFNVSREEAIEYIQRVIDLTKEIHGTENANVNVILAFACTGNEQQLRKILLNPVVKFNSEILLSSLNYLKNRSKINAVVIIARCARGLHHTSISEEKLYEFLLGDFVRTNDYASATELYEEIQQDDYKIVSKKFNRTLADLLAKNNQPLPEKLKFLSN
ncbi:leucine-rich PPR motif-containing protein, mitochondrial [Sitodiplosis mosellana]|uniref:leucine-rich PPR motif-containing protein, mitochondrial n=1 Tax=Sitodiplosis mosellana TaxID=263140 RepID=UPI00244440FB|nr:leucine-rich PPR motif-containing protein, mitochondrial [Sitodiplosis mosellana]